MENIFTIKVRRKPHNGHIYPSERRYSASNVMTLAWVHLALAALSCLLIILITTNGHCLQNKINNNKTYYHNDNSSLIDYNLNNRTGYIIIKHLSLIMPPTLIAIFGLTSGITAILASAKWYVDSHIKWLFTSSILTTMASVMSLLVITASYLTEETEHIFVVKNEGVIDRNMSHMIVKSDSILKEYNYDFFCNIITLNVILVAILELLWSILTLRISYKGLITDYNNCNKTPRNCVTVITKIKGKNHITFLTDKQLKSLTPQLLEQYTHNKIKQILADIENCAKDGSVNGNKNANSDLYKEGIMTFLNSTKLDKNSHGENEHSVNAGSHSISEIHDLSNVDLKRNVTPLSWGDSDTVYNQNTINFDKIFNFKKSEDATVKIDDKMDE